jgi:hypothetical protein
MGSVVGVQPRVAWCEPKWTVLAGWWTWRLIRRRFGYRRSDLAGAVKAAVGDAQDGLAGPVADLLAESAEALPGRDRLTRTLSELANEAERTMAEMSTAMGDLLRQAGRR